MTHSVVLHLTRAILRNWQNSLCRLYATLRELSSSVIFYYTRYKLSETEMTIFCQSMVSCPKLFLFHLKWSTEERKPKNLPFFLDSRPCNWLFDEAISEYNVKSNSRLVYGHPSFFFWILVSRRLSFRTSWWDMYTLGLPSL